MKKIILNIVILVFAQLLYASGTHTNFFNTRSITSTDSTTSVENILEQRLKVLDDASPFDFVYNQEVDQAIQFYIKRNKIISRMVGLSPFYFPMMESILDKYNIPLEMKYLAVIESGLNPKATSSSGAKGLWQFIFSTGKLYNLEVNSYMDERQDPIKSTEAACQYFTDLYAMFGDWNLVLAAYNGGPGYLSRTMAEKGIYDFWELIPHLRKETREYVPRFIAMSYMMQYYEEHEIEVIYPSFLALETDTITLEKQMSFEIMCDELCVDKETLFQLNPCLTREIFPANYTITLPKDQLLDLVLNKESFYIFAEKVNDKEILVNEQKRIHTVKKGDYLGKIARENNVTVHNIRKWNNLKNDNLSVGDHLVLFVKEEVDNQEEILTENKVYIVKKGDTLWNIAKQYKGISVAKLIEYNKLNSNTIKPGTKLVLPI